MLLPPSGPRSNCTALGLKFSEENWLNTPWADRRSDGWMDTSPTSTSIRPMATLRAAALVEPLNGRPWKIGRQDLPVLLARARSAHRAPLAQAEAVSRPRACRDEPSDRSVLARHRQLERRALQQPTRLRPQHGAHLRARHADVAVLEHDAELADAPRRTGAAHRNVGDALQAIAADMHHGRERPRQYSAQLRAVPFLAPTEPRREVAVGVAATARVGDGTQVGAALRGAERLPAVAVLEGKAARNDRLGEQRLLLVVAPDADLTCQHAREVALHRHPVQQGQPGGVPHYVDAATVAAAARHREAVFGDVHGGDTAVTLAPGAIGLDDAQAARIRDNGPRHAGRDGADRRPVPVVRDEQLSVAS